MSSALNALNASAGIAAGAAGSLASDYGSVGHQLSVYIADITKGILIVVAAGLGAGMVLSLVGGWYKWRAGRMGRLLWQVFAPALLGSSRTGCVLVVGGGRASETLFSPIDPAIQIWMLVLRFFAGLMAWATIAAVNLGLAGCTLYCYYQSGRLSAVRWRGGVG
jgi:hypothetical protein